LAFFVGNVNFFGVEYPYKANVFDFVAEWRYFVGREGNAEIVGDEEDIVYVAAIGKGW